MRCARCESPTKASDIKCRACGLYQTEEFEAPESEEVEEVSAKRDLSIPTSLLDAEEETHERVVTGPWDPAFSYDEDTQVSGVVCGASVLLSGSPGGGKSTLVLQIADALLRTNRWPCVYYAGIEETASKIRARAERLNIAHVPKILTYQPYDSLAQGLSAKAPLILDSLSRYRRGDAERMNVLKELTDYAALTGAPVIAIAHITKDDPFAGRIELQHEVDTTIHIAPRNPDTDDPVRIMTTYKNRFGKAPHIVRLKMTAHGLEGLSVDEVEESSVERFDGGQ
jgi:DNA repair protein RadA/Sms